MFHAAMLHSSMATGDISNSNNNSCNIYSCCNMSCCNNARLWPLGHCGMWHAAAACGKTYARTLTRKTGSKNGRQQRVASRGERARERRQQQRQIRSQRYRQVVATPDSTYAAL